MPLRAPATLCSIKLAGNSQDGSPTGVRGDCEVRNPSSALQNLKVDDRRVERHIL